MLRAVKTKCIIRPELIKKDTGVIEVAETSKNANDVHCFVENVGPDVDIKEIKVGVRVQINMATVAHVKVDGKNFLIVDQSDILAVYTGKAGK